MGWVLLLTKTQAAFNTPGMECPQPLSLGSLTALGSAAALPHSCACPRFSPSTVLLPLALQAGLFACRHTGAGVPCQTCALHSLLC